MSKLKIVTDELFLSKFTKLNSLVEAMVNHLGHDLAKTLEIDVDEDLYKYTFIMRSLSGDVLSSKTIDLPLESVVVNIRYDDATDSIIFELVNGNSISVPISDITRGFATESQLEQEINDRVEAISELSDNINEEANASRQRDDALDGRISAEASARLQADKQIQNEIKDSLPFFIGEDGYIYGKD